MNSREPKKGKSKIIILALITTALLALNLFNQGPAGYWHEIRALRDQLSFTRAEKERLSAILAGAGEVEAEWELLFSEEERLETLFPLERELPFALVELEKLLAGYPLELRRLQMGEKKYLYNHGLVMVSLAASGCPAEAEAFLYRAANLPRFLAFDSITLTRSGDDEVMIDLELELFFIDSDLIDPYTNLLDTGLPGYW